MSLTPISGTSALEAQVLTPEQEAAQALQDALEALAMGKAIQVNTEDDYRAADGAVVAIKNAMKRSESKRDELVRPLNTVVKKINAEFKRVSETFEAALAAYRKPMTAFQVRLAEERRKAEEQARQEAEARRREAEEIARQEQERMEAAQLQAKQAEDPFAAALAQAEAEAATESFKVAVRQAHAPLDIPEFVPKVTGAGSKTFTVWGFEITDPTLIPRDYFVLDTARIAREVKEQKESFNVPGIKATSRLEVK